MTDFPEISKDLWALELTPAKHQRDFYICPFCGSGTGPKGTAAFSFRDQRHGHCFACKFDGDRYDAELMFMGIDPSHATKEEKLKAARNVMARYDFAPSVGSQRPAAPAADHKPAAAPEPARDFTDFYHEAHKALLNSPEALDYLHGRGISDFSIDKFNLGYCSAWKHSKAPDSAPATKRIIIPRSSGTYTARRIDKPLNDYEANFVKQIEGKQIDLFNISAIDTAEAENADVVWVVEGELDAISLYQAGALAVVGIGSISNCRRFVDLAKQHPRLAYILALDNDRPDPNGIRRGYDAQQKLAEELAAAGLVCYNVDTVDFYGNAKDANDSFLQDQNRLLCHVAMIETKACEEKQLQKEKLEAELYSRSGAGMLDSFFELAQTREFEPIPTGISDIDRATHGGFTSKTLVLLSGAPGLGKTALAQHITENIAKSGRDILFINLEMSRDQLLARSLARFVWVNEKADLSPLDVLRGYAWTDDQRAALLRAAESYKREIAPRFVYNPDGVTNAMDSILQAMLSETIRIKAMNRPAPIICIDYLQLIDSGDRDPIEGLKRVIYQLKAFAKENNTVVIAISATNRASNKTGTVDLESGRDTSATEYSGDMMLGLSYTALEDRRQYETGKTKDGKPIMTEYTLDELRRLRRVAYDLGQNPPEICNEISLKVLKNRFGEPERRAKLHFDGRHNLYTMAYAEAKEFSGQDWVTITK